MGVSSKVLQDEQRIVFAIPKLNNFFIEKEYVIDNFALERTQGSIGSC